MILQKLPDGTINPAWVAAHRGCLGASSINEILRKGQGGKPSKMRISLARKLAAERWAGFAMDNLNPDNPDIARGNFNEAPALAEYEAINGVIVRPAAWIEHPSIEGAGATPDAFVGNDGTIQIKSPRPMKMLSIVFEGEIPADHIDQMDWEMAVTGRQWSDFILYNHELPEGRRIWIRRRYRDDERIKFLEEQVTLFMDEVQAYFDFLCSAKFYEEETA